MMYETARYEPMVRVGHGATPLKALVGIQYSAQGHFSRGRRLMTERDFSSDPLFEGRWFYQLATMLSTVRIDLMFKMNKLDGK